MSDGRGESMKGMPQKMEGRHACVWTSQQYKGNSEQPLIAPLNAMHLCVCLVGSSIL